MKITVQSSKAVKPDYGGGNGAPSAAADVVPLTVLDKVNFDQHISDIFFFHPPAPSSHTLETGLARALAVYREWAGRLVADDNAKKGGGDRAAIQLNDAGVRFVEATADVALGSVMPLDPSPELLRLHPCGDGAAELMLVQVTRFACGGFAVATTGQHLVSDGRAARAFIVAWGKAVRGAALEAVHADRAGVFAPRSPPRVEFEHRGVEFKKKHRDHGEEEESVVVNAGGGGDHGDAGDEVVVRMVRFSRETVAKLKSRASAGGRQCSTFQCLAAHLWRCVTKARGLAGDETTALKIAVDGRARMRDPPVPEGYTGNVVLWARPTATVDELLTSPLKQVVELISKAVARVDDGYFRSFIDFASSGVVEEEGLVPTADPAKTVHCPDVEVYSQMGIPLYDLDFGTGRPFLYLPSYLPEEGLVFILPSASGDGSIDVQVCLFSCAMDIFKNCCYDLTEAEGQV